MTQSAYKPFPKPSISSDAAIEPKRLQLGIRPAVFFILIGVLLTLFVVRLAVGSVTIPIEDIVKVLMGGEASKSTWTHIVLNFRVPRAITAILAGAALSVSGLMMQTLFRNPLAGPFVLGISSGASLGVALVVLTTGSIGGALLTSVGLRGEMGIAFAASVGAGVTMTLVLLVARNVQSSVTLLILGLMFGYLTGAAVSLLFYFAVPEQIRSYLDWTFGSFDGVTWNEMRILAPTVLAGLAITFTLSKSLNALLLGEQYAQSMGVNIQQARFAIVTATALLAGSVTAFCGPLAFIGIATPHLSRCLLNTSDHRVLIPATILMGGIVALGTAMIAQVPGSETILPLNPVMAFTGAPIVIWVIIRQRSLHKSFGS